jgi:hypothetical protein
VVRRGHCEHGPCAGKSLALPVDTPVREQEACDEHEDDGGAADPGAQGDRFRALALLNDLLAGE